MSLQLQPDQLLVALKRMDHPQAGEFEVQLFGLCNQMAQAVVEGLPNLELSPSIRTNLEFDMVCTPISPIDSSLPIPEALLGLDDGGWE